MGLLPCGVLGRLVGKISSGIGGGGRRTVGGFRVEGGAWRGAGCGGLLGGGWGCGCVG